MGRMDGGGEYVELVQRQEVLTEHCAAQQMCGRGGAGVAVIVVQYKGQSYVCVNKTWLIVDRQRKQFQALDRAV
jgi:hypothetical protein